jgi:hypothetical protein
VEAEEMKWKERKGSGRRGKEVEEEGGEGRRSENF